MTSRPGDMGRGGYEDKCGGAARATIRELGIEGQPGRTNIGES